MFIAINYLLKWSVQANIMIAMMIKKIPNVMTDSQTSHKQFHDLKFTSSGHLEIRTVLRCFSKWSTIELFVQTSDEASNEQWYNWLYRQHFAASFFPGVNLSKSFKHWSAFDLNNPSPHVGEFVVVSPSSFSSSPYSSLSSTSWQFIVAIHINSTHRSDVNLSIVIRFCLKRWRFKIGW